MIAQNIISSLDICNTAPMERNPGRRSVPHPDSLRSCHGSKPGHRSGLAALALLAALISGCDSGESMMMAGQATPVKYQNNGERIYFTGYSGSGEPVTYSGGNMHLRMMGGGCATCHGASRRGARMMPEFWTVAPPLTRDALFGDHEDQQGHDDHESYDWQSLQRAIAQGIDPSGEQLDSIMPRWSMNEGDWRDLLTYLRE